VKITFVSQKPPCFIERDALHVPVDLAQQCALKASNYHYSQLNDIDDDYDVIILLIPKTPDDREQLYQLDIVGLARNKSKSVWFMQEGPAWIFQDLPLHQQFWHYNVLASVDGILCENETDIPYFKGLVPDKPVYDIPSVMIEDNITQYRDIEKEDKVMIGGNFVRWYGGFDSYIVAREFNIPIFAPSMGRKIENEEQIDDLTHYPYLNWNEWIKTLATHKYAVHLMTTIAAGTFSMNCGFLGIPCIGYEEADTQRKIHPSLSVKIGDLESARKLVIQLRDDKDFWKKCSDEASDNYTKYFSEKTFLGKMEKRLS
jgi:hypothetical protein